MFGVCFLLAALALLVSSPASPSQDYCYRGVAGGTESFSVIGEPAWSARSVEATLCPLAGPAGSLAIVLHHQDDSNLYLFLYGTGSTALRIYRKVANAYTLLASTPFSIPLGEEHVMRAEDTGDGLLQLYMDDVLRVAVIDSTFSAGRVGLRVWNLSADFDDVLALDATGDTLVADDFQDGNAAGWDAGPGWSVIEQGGGAEMPLPSLDASFEGGNVEVRWIDLPTWTVHLRPELEGGSPYRAWFYFQMSNISSAQPTHFVFDEVDFFTHPFYSYDDVTWTEFPAPSGGTYSLTISQDPIWIAHSPPYITRHAQALIDDVQGADVQVDVLATSEGGLPVHELIVTAPGPSMDRFGVWCVARQHAWEASGSWIADGLVRWLASAEPQAVALRHRAEVHVVPIMDVDTVVLGGSGKDQQPIDFNRDWRAEPHWNAVRDAITALDEYAAARSYDLFFDLHCPGSASTFLFVQRESMVSPECWQTFHEFRQIFAATAGSGTLPYTGAYQELGPEYHPLWDQISFWHQFLQHPELRLSLTLETRTASPGGYRGLAEGLGRALEEFLPAAADQVELAAGRVTDIEFTRGHPNPFRTTTTFFVDVPSSGNLRLSVHDAMGRRVRLLLDAVRTAGFHEIEWDGMDDHGSQVPAGVYFLALDSAGRRVTRKVVALK